MSLGLGDVRERDVICSGRMDDRLNGNQKGIESETEKRTEENDP